MPEARLPPPIRADSCSSCRCPFSAAAVIAFFRLSGVTAAGVGAGCGCGAGVAGGATIVTFPAVLQLALACPVLRTHATRRYVPAGNVLATVIVKVSVRVAPPLVLLRLPPASDRLAPDAPRSV